MNGKMRFKDFVFEANPFFIEMRHDKGVSKKALINGTGIAVDGAEKPVEICIKGYLYGNSAFENASELERLQGSGGAGWLYLPQGNCYKAIFKELTVSFDAVKNRYCYTALFVESSDGRRHSRDFDYTLAGENENMFHIAFRCDVPIERLMLLNDFKNPFAVCAGDKVVLK